MQTGDGTLPSRERQHIDTVELYGSIEDFVARLARDHRCQGALAGTVRTHHRVHLTRRHGEVDPSQDLFALYSNTQIGDDERAHERSPRFKLTVTTTLPSMTALHVIGLDVEVGHALGP